MCTMSKKGQISKFRILKSFFFLINPLFKILDTSIPLATELCICVLQHCNFQNHFVSIPHKSLMQYYIPVHVLLISRLACN